MKKKFRNYSLLRGVTAFTLAEVLITLGIIGIVAAITVPTLMKNYQEKIQKEKVRMVKYKLTQATSVMNTDGLIKSYPTTQDFVNELQKYLKISKTCKNNELAGCWPSETISVPDSTGKLTTINVADIKKGSNLKSLGIGTKNTDTMGMVLADGTPIILTYSPKCTALEQYRSYEYSTQDGKPVTNATTNCISAIFDVNGKSKPNKIGTDVRTLNSLFGYQLFPENPISKAECEKLKSKKLVKDCLYNGDYWAGAVKKCNDIGLHLPDMQTLAAIAAAKYGRSDIGTYTIIAKSGAYNSFRKMCTDYPWQQKDGSDKILCADPNEIPTDTESAVGEIEGYIFSSQEESAEKAWERHLDSVWSDWYLDRRTQSQRRPLCVGD